MRQMPGLTVHEASAQQHVLYCPHICMIRTRTVERVEGLEKVIIVRSKYSSVGEHGC